MHRTKELLISISNVATWLALGVCYSQLVQSAMSFLYRRWPEEVIFPAEKMLLSGASAAIAIATVFAFNRLITRQSMLGVGICCGLMAFVYFYIIRSWPEVLIIVLFPFTYSFFALLMFTVAPILAGLLFHRACKLSGLHVLLSQRR